MAEAITIIATYRPLPALGDTARALVADLQKAAAEHGVKMTVSPETSGGIIIDYAVPNHDTLDATLPMLAPLLEALTEAALLAKLAVDGPLRADAAASFSKLHAGLSAA